MPNKKKLLQLAVAATLPSGVVGLYASARKDLPRLPALHARQGVTFEAPGGALARWNAGLKAKDGDDDDQASISIYEWIGDDGWGGGVSVRRIAAALRSIGKKDVVVNINSPGGDLFEGIAIYNVLRDHPGHVTTRVVGMAASSASVIAMAGDTIQIARAGFMMVHNVWVVAIGNRNDLREAADQLEPFDDALADVYAARTGLEKADVAAMMDKETWLSGSQAIDKGFADELLPADAVEEKDEGETSAAAAMRQLDVILAKGGLPRSKRRALLNQVRGTPSAAPATTPSAGAVERMLALCDSVAVRG